MSDATSTPVRFAIRTRATHKERWRPAGLSPAQSGSTTRNAERGKRTLIMARKPAAIWMDTPDHDTSGKSVWAVSYFEVLR